ncbi:MAG: PilN domain-containing protein [Synechococcales bacterium]|nr:PilN domain-containing protein [Synechococcales bacterium]
MYSLDINFLNDRPDLKPDAGGRGGRGGGRRPGGGGGGSDSKVPMYVGIGVGLMALLGVLGGWAALTALNSGLESRNAELDGQLGSLEAKKKELKAANDKVKAAEGEIQALASVFNRVKPWSAMSQDLRDRLPAGIQIAGIRQIPNKSGTPPADGTEPPSPYAGPVEILGAANTFEEVNDFLVVLQKSKFLKPEMTKIKSAEQRESVPLANSGAQNAQGGRTPQVKLPGKVGFLIQTELSDVPTSELMRELERKGAVGIVTRIETLKSKGVKP